MTAKKRNPQDATRKRDVAPLRDRIKVLEDAVKDLAQRMKKLEGGK